MSQTHDLAEWAEFLSLGVAVHASFSFFYFLLVDAHREDFPGLWQAVVDARHDVDWTVASVLHLAASYVLVARLTARSAVATARRAPLDAAVTGAALAALLLPATEGATR